MATKENNSANKVSTPLLRREGQGGGSHVLDITKEHCPMTFVKTKIELSKLRKDIMSSPWSMWREQPIK